MAPTISSISRVIQQWACSSVEAYALPLESGLVLVTHSTNKYDTSDVLGLLMLGHVQPHSSHLDLWELALRILTLGTQFPCCNVPKPCVEG